ncbi:MAG: serine/threonine protein kinase [Chitinispirillaceae bacterium]|jgi:predicted Ser/Thr protein kinase|nr:serine/threonine protein kinase [Chitinispirillaceae bacterium]
MVPQIPRGFTHPMRIGEGAFASVYRVRQPLLDRFVAIKIILEKDRGQRKQLLKEANVQAHIQLECIPHVYDAFEWKKSVCIVMEYIKGTSLETLLKNPLSADDRCSLADNFLVALAGMHALGYAHRDIKPANVLVSPKGIHFVDFGFARHAIDGEKSMAMAAKGTPAFMAPEIWQHGSNIDLIRADVFSAGKVIQQILSDDNAPIVIRMTRNHPDNRPSSGKDALDEWRSACGSRPGAGAGWPALAERLASSQLSEQLVYAAKQLLFAGRSDEAYWLLVEALEENPDQAEAVTLMSEFERFGKKRRQHTILRFAAVIVAAAALALTAFVVGRQSTVIVREDRHRGGRAPVIDIKEKAGARFDVVGTILKEDTSSSDMLSGKVVAAGLPLRGKLFVDRKEADQSLLETQGIDLAPGPHLLAWKGPAGDLLWKERISLLPFQTIVVAIAPSTRKKPRIHED